MSNAQVLADRENMKIARLSLGPFGTNAYVITCPRARESLLIDAPAEAGLIMEKLNDTKTRYILLTHSHMDHVGALADLRSQGIPLAAHPADSASLHSPADVFLKEGDTVKCGELELEIIHTPGHTKGSLSFVLEGFLFSGDTLFPGGPGKTRSPQAFKEIISSITEKLFLLPDDTMVLPGHGDGTRLKEEKDAYNQFASRSQKHDLWGDVTWHSS